MVSRSQLIEVAAEREAVAVVSLLGVVVVPVVGVDVSQLLGVAALSKGRVAKPVLDR